VFVGVAGLLTRKGDKQHPVQLLSLAEQHEASAYETQERARSLLNELAPAGPDDGPTATKASDQVLDWQTTAEEVIKILTSTPD
jgi:hypothetical protein